MYTDGCAELLWLAAQDLRMKRRLKAAVADAGHDSQAAAEAQKLAERRAALGEQERQLRAEVRKLRAVLDWEQRCASGREGPAARRAAG